MYKIELYYKTWSDFTFRHYLQCEREYKFDTAPTKEFCRDMTDKHNASGYMLYDTTGNVVLSETSHTGDRMRDEGKFLNKEFVSDCKYWWRQIKPLSVITY